MKRNSKTGRVACIVVLSAVLAGGCGSGEVKTEQPALIGMVKLAADDGLDMVTWEVDGTFGDPELGSFDWELKQDDAVLTWSGLAVKKDSLPGAPGVYYIDSNGNGMIDVGDTFRVKAPSDGDYTLYWTHRSSGNMGRYDSHY